MKPDLDHFISVWSVSCYTYRNTHFSTLALIHTRLCMRTHTHMHRHTLVGVVSEGLGGALETCISEEEAGQKRTEKKEDEGLKKRKNKEDFSLIVFSSPSLMPSYLSSLSSHSLPVSLSLYSIFLSLFRRIHSVLTCQRRSSISHASYCITSPRMFLWASPKCILHWAHTHTHTHTLYLYTVCI